MLAGLAPAGASIVDALLEERRREAAREDRESVPSTILDASALLAYLRDEPGADVVADAVATGAVISTVNLGEVLSRVADRDTDPARVARQMTDRGLLDGAIAVEPRSPPTRHGRSSVYRLNSPDPLRRSGRRHRAQSPVPQAFSNDFSVGEASC